MIKEKQTKMIQLQVALPVWNKLGKFFYDSKEFIYWNNVPYERIQTPRRQPILSQLPAKSDHKSLHWERQVCKRSRKLGRKANLPKKRKDTCSRTILYALVTDSNTNTLPLLNKCFKNTTNLRKIFSIVSHLINMY